MLNSEMRTELFELIGVVSYVIPKATYMNYSDLRSFSKMGLFISRACSLLGDEELISIPDKEVSKDIFNEYTILKNEATDYIGWMLFFEKETVDSSVILDGYENFSGNYLKELNIPKQNSLPKEKLKNPPTQEDVDSGWF